MLTAALPQGFLSEEDAAELMRLAEDRIVLEMGAWQGKSTVALARTARYVISVDRHQGIPDSQLPDSLPGLLENVRDLDNVAIVVASFEDFVPLLGRVELVFIDGDHAAENVARDARLAVSLHPDIMAFHDWKDPAVRDGASSVIAEQPDHVSGTVAVFYR